MNHESIKGKPKSIIRDLIDFSVIKQDWVVLKNWFFNPISKKFRWGMVILIFFLFGFMSIPIFLPIMNPSLNNLALLMAFALTAPLLMVFIPILSNFGMNLALSVLWINEKDDISRFRSFSKKEIRPILRSRLLIPFLASFLVEWVLIIIMIAFIYLFYIQFQIFPVESGGMWLYFLGVLIFNIFSATFLSWNAINHGNYLRFKLPQYPIEKPSKVSNELFHQINELRCIYLDKTGFFLNHYIIIAVSMFYFFPLALTALLISVNREWNAIIINFQSIIWYWFWLMNIIFLIVSWILWKRIPQSLQNIPESRYIIPNEYKDFFRHGY